MADALQPPVYTPIINVLKNHASLILYDNIKVDISKVLLEGVDWIHVSEDGVCWQTGSCGRSN
jgi:hypothetical protein